jgi:putative oxidoreductase
MLNPFPDLLTYSTFGPFVLRLVLGLIFIDLGVLKFRAEKQSWINTFKSLSLKPAEHLVTLYAVLEILGGILLVLGLWTQVAALAFVIFTGIELYIEWTEGAVLKRNITFYVLLFVIALSLLVTGAGAFAFDLPL